MAIEVDITQDQPWMANDPLRILSKEVKEAAKGISRDEARHLVDAYYQLQHDRLAANNQIRAIMQERDDGVAPLTLTFFAENFQRLENGLKIALGAWAQHDPLGKWALSIRGIGPVLAAGLLAHIDIARCSHVAPIWRFAGLDPSLKWEKGQKRPYNARLKTLCWKVADSFIKCGGPYREVYDHRKAFELARDARGENSETAAKTLEERNIQDKVTRATYESGHLPLGRLDLRARRFTVKLFLAHYHHVGFELLHGVPPQRPYILEHSPHHSAFIAPPNWPMEP
jgi:hypothetical protein